MEETKTCTGCQNTLPISEYYFGKKANKHYAKCKKCHSAHCLRNQADMRKNDPFLMATIQKKKQAKSRGIEFNLTRDFLEDLWQQQDGKCAALGTPIEFNRDLRSDSLATIDRIIPHLGYTQGNVKWLSGLANRVKNNCTDPQVFRNIADYVEQTERVKEPQFDFSFPS